MDHHRLQWRLSVDIAGCQNKGPSSRNGIRECCLCTSIEPDRQRLPIRIKDVDPARNCRTTRVNERQLCRPSSPHRELRKDDRICTADGTGGTKCRRERVDGNRSQRSGISHGLRTKIGAREPEAENRERRAALDVDAADECLTYGVREQFVNKF